MPSTMPGTTSGSSSRLLRASRPLKRKRDEAERRRHAEAKTDAGGDHGKLQAEQETGDEAIVAGNGPEPAQRIALRRETTGSPGERTPAT